LGVKVKVQTTVVRDTGGRLLTDCGELPTSPAAGPRPAQETEALRGFALIATTTFRTPRPQMETM
jgi:hypothetical protein